MVSFKDITTQMDSERMKESIPENMREYEFIKMDNILDMPISVVDYALYESKDKVKYAVDNTKGVHIVIMTDDGKKYRTSTHGKRIVKAFEYLDANGGINEPIETQITKITTNQGQSMLDFKF